MKSTVWRQIESLQWGKDFDYERIQKELAADSKLRAKLENFTRNRWGDLHVAIQRFQKKRKQSLNIGSDDGYSDTLYHIVGLGEEEFNKCIKNPLLVEEHYNGKYGTVAGYSECFVYGFHPIEDED